MNKETISSSQLAILVTAYALGSSLVLSTSNSAVRSGWIAVALGAIEGLLIALLFTTLSERFHRQSLVQMAQQVFGRTGGLIPSLLFVGFMLQLGGLVLGNFGDYFEITVLQRTPDSWFIISLALTAVYAVRRGIGVLARATTVLLPITVFLVLATFALLLPKMVPENVLPMIDVDGRKLLAAAHGSAMFPFGEAVVFLMVLPHLSTEYSTRKPVLLGLLLASLVLTANTFGNITVLGAAIENTVFPSFSAARLIEVGEVFARLEMLGAINFLTMGFVKVAILLYGAANGLAHAFGLHSYKPLVLPAGLLMIVLAISGFEHGFAENVVFVAEAWPYYAPLFVIGLPLVILMGAVIAGQPRRDKN